MPPTAGSEGLCRRSRRGPRPRAHDNRRSSPLQPPGRAPGRRDALPSARHHHSKGSSWPCPKSSVSKTFSARLSAPAATISPDGTKIAYLAPWQDRLNVWVQSVDSDDEPRRVTADDNRSVVHLPVDRRSALDAVHAGRQRRRELARVPGRPGEPGCARRRSHAVPGGQGHVRSTRRTAWEGDRPPQQQEGRTLRRVRNRHRHGRTHPARREPRPCRVTGSAAETATCSPAR